MHRTGALGTGYESPAVVQCSPKNPECYLNGFLKMSSDICDLIKNTQLKFIFSQCLQNKSS